MSIFNKANILLPKNADMTKWSVVACDQYTSEKEYWDKVTENTKNTPSTINLIFPEAYLSTVDFEGKISEINSAMQEYLDKGVFEEYKDALIFVKRTFESGKVRCGLIGAVDLEEYDYSKDSTSNIRATEATVAERIPARVTIRRNAPIELPHILLLMDDKEDAVLGSLKKTVPGRKLYDFTLMEHGGKIEGYLIDNADEVLKTLHGLGTNPIIAVGDGNHSLAGAKAAWEEVKAALPDSEKENHPMRFALAELVNLYEDSLVFEPIYRVFFGCDEEKLLDAFCKSEGKFSHTVPYSFKGKKGDITFSSDCHIPSGAVTEVLEAYAKENGGKIDYIHGYETALTMGNADGNIAFFAPCLKKEDLFKSVNTYGPLPKKTFSMGHAEEKRFYTEARRIKK
ncbi:MAG: DUF1015 domain-containing protein [Clostridia bacterium]|nr:DUF1015 domain-containing protein [Clostridia bacterium]